jgi:hypothetical protein
LGIVLNQQDHRFGENRIGEVPALATSNFPAPRPFASLDWTARKTLGSISLSAQNALTLCDRPSLFVGWPLYQSDPSAASV